MNLRMLVAVRIAFCDSTCLSDSPVNDYLFKFQMDGQLKYENKQKKNRLAVTSSVFLSITYHLTTQR